VIADVPIEGEFVYESLKWSNLGAGERLNEEFRSAFAEFDPVLPVPSEFVRRVHPPSRVLEVVGVDLGMTFEADWDCVFDPVPAILIDMVRLDLDAAKTVADATTSAASHEEVCYLVSC